MLLFYIRHGDPIYDPDSLTPLGERQAEAVGRRLAMFGVDRIYSSTSTRAMQTARPACEMTKQELTALDFCNENHAWADLAVDCEDGRRRWAFETPQYRKIFISEDIRRLGKRWHEDPRFADTRFRPGMERIARESDRLLADLGYEHDPDANCYRAVRPNDDRIALFAHAGFGLAFLSHLLDIPYPEFSTRFDLCHSSMTVVEFPNDEGICIPRILTLSSDAHLYREGLPTLYNNRIRF